MKLKLAPNQLPYLDHGHYRLTQAQARAICGADGLPRYGYARVLRAGALAGYTFGEIRCTEGTPTHFREFSGANHPETLRGEVLRTPISWFGGETVKAGWVWAVHIFSTNR